MKHLAHAHIEEEGKKSKQMECNLYLQQKKGRGGRTDKHRGGGKASRPNQPRI